MVDEIVGYLCGALCYRTALYGGGRAMGAARLASTGGLAMNIASNVGGAVVVVGAAVMAYEAFDVVTRRRYTSGRGTETQMYAALSSLPVFIALRLATTSMRASWFRCLANSDLWRPGSYAVSSLKCAGPEYLGGEKGSLAIVALGNRHGCHSCGVRNLMSSRWNDIYNKSRLRKFLELDARRRTFNADHQPPSGLIAKKLVPKKTMQVFYPHCTDCSQLQGTSVRTEARTLVPHSFVYGTRWWHLWLPFPILQRV